MGLDVTAYKQVSLIDTQPHYEVYAERYPWDSNTSTVYVYSLRSFQEHSKGLIKGGVYRYEDSDSFRAGSYSGYNRFREWLSEAVLGVEPKTVWNDPEPFKERPFYWLINFSDCEGYIDAERSAKLAADFAEYEHITDELEPDHWFRRVYANFRKAFEMASDNGFVEYH